MKNTYAAIQLIKSVGLNAEIRVLPHSGKEYIAVFYGNKVHTLYDMIGVRTFVKQVKQTQGNK